MPLVKKPCALCGSVECIINYCILTVGNIRTLFTDKNKINYNETISI